MNHTEIQSLLGAYALDAVDVDEREEIASHLEICATCRREVEENLEVAASLAVAAGDDAPVVQPPPELWSDIQARLGTDERANVISLDHRSASTSRGSRWLFVVVSVAAALLLIAVIGTSIDVSRLDGRVAALSSRIHDTNMADQMAAVLAQVDHHSINLTSSEHQTRARVVIGTDGTSFFVNEGLAVLPSRYTYQLWALSRGHVVSLGVLGAKPTINAFRFEAPMSALMVNVEPVGGSSAPTTPVLAQAVVA